VTEAVRADVGDDFKIIGVGATGSGRFLAEAIVNADFVIDELTAHAKASLYEFKKLKETGEIPADSQLGNTIDIGGEDYKAIEYRNERPIKSVMNSRCAAGTGGFLDYQSAELGISVEEFGDLALNAKMPVLVASRCTVFARTDIISKQTEGHRLEDIVAGLCAGLVRNYLSGVGKTVRFHSSTMFQGGVAANKGMVKAFQEHFGSSVQIIVPNNYGEMGAIGVALLTHEEFVTHPKPSNFVGWNIPEIIFDTKPFKCRDCSNLCTVIELFNDDKLAARWGSKCGKWHDINLDRKILSDEEIQLELEEEENDCSKCVEEEISTQSMD
jgi:predicted CoA-substrate-specific enzyme activase